MAARGAGLAWEGTQGSPSEVGKAVSGGEGWGQACQGRDEWDGHPVPELGRVLVWGLAALQAPAWCEAVSRDKRTVSLAVRK